MTLEGIHVMHTLGTVASVTMSETLEPPLETVMIHVKMKPDKILKGSKTVEAIEIEVLPALFRG